MGVQIFFVESQWSNYKENLVSALKIIKHRYNVEGCVFGDIDLVTHKDFEEEVCQLANIYAILPLWQRDRLSVNQQIIQSGMQCKISVVNKSLYVLHQYIGTEYASMDFDLLRQHKIDVCGENGEFHTLVYQYPELHIEIALTNNEIIVLDTVILCDFT